MRWSACKTSSSAHRSAYWLRRGFSQPLASCPSLLPNDGRILALRQGISLSGEIPMSLIVLKHCTLWDGTSPEVREDMHVLVEGERIREISEHSITAPQAQVINCEGK